MIAKTPLFSVGGAPVVVFGEAMIELSDVTASSAALGVGGDTFNTAVYLARSGIDTAYVSALGDCPFSRRISSALEAEGISTSHMCELPGGSPGLYAIETDETGERSFTYWRSASAVRSFFACRDAEAALEAMSAARLLYLSGISLSLFSEQEQLKLIEIAGAVRANGGTVVFDTNYRPRGWSSSEAARRAVRAMMPSVSIALPTFDDEQDLFGYTKVEECIAAWVEAGAEEVCAKLGPRGAFVSGTGLIPPRSQIKPLDTTGAGDSFNGAYIAARLQGADPAAAALAGHELAARVLMVAGALLPQPPNDAVPL